MTTISYTLALIVLMIGAILLPNPQGLLVCTIGCFMLIVLDQFIEAIKSLKLTQLNINWPNPKIDLVVK